MTISSDPISMRSLATTYTLGLAAGSVTNLIIRNKSTDVKQEVICSLTAGLGALVIGILWKYTGSEDNATTSSSESTSINVTSSTKTTSENSKLSPLTIFYLGAFSGANLCGNRFSTNFLNGFCTAGLALAARDKEKEDKVN